MKKSLPLPTDNPTGLHRKYLVKKFSHIKKSVFGWFQEPVYKDLEPGEEYFLLRLDENGKDHIHRNACRKAVLHYADLIKDHLPELSKDLIERYS